MYSFFIAYWKCDVPQKNLNYSHNKTIKKHGFSSWKPSTFTTITIHKKILHTTHKISPSQQCVTHYTSIIQLIDALSAVRHIWQIRIVLARTHEKAYWGHFIDYTKIEFKDAHNASTAYQVLVTQVVVLRICLTKLKVNWSRQVKSQWTLCYNCPHSKRTHCGLSVDNLFKRQNQFMAGLAKILFR